MKKQADRLQVLIGAVEIGNIRLVDLTASTSVRSTDEAGSISLSVKTTTSVRERTEEIFFVATSIDMQLVSKEKAVPVVTIKAGFELSYRLPHGFAATTKDLELFAKINGVYNAWPYWRELIQNTLMRMNLPPVTLPLLRMARKP